MNEIETKIKEAERELEQETHNLARLKNRKTYYENGERQKRAHRLITRGAAVESLAPSVKDMGEVEFYELAEKIFTLPEVKNLIAKETNYKKSSPKMKKMQKRYGTLDKRQSGTEKEATNVTERA